MNDGSTDGHYYRDDHGITQGPLDFEEFERLQIKGRIKPGMKVWRQKAGAYFQVQMKRRYTIGKMFSFSSVGYFFELIFILISLLMIIFIFRAPKLQEELMNESDGIIIIDHLCDLIV